MQDRRRTARKPVYLGGRIVFNHRQSTMECLLRNMGDQGAKVVFTNTSCIPDEFELHVTRLEQTFGARVTWRRLDELGVSFAPVPSATVIPFQQAIRLRQLEAEKTKLERRVRELSSGE